MNKGQVVAQEFLEDGGVIVNHGVLVGVHDGENFLLRFRVIRREGQCDGGGKYPEEQFHIGSYEKTALTTSPASTVGRSARPLCRKVSLRWSRPINQRMVA